MGDTDGAKDILEEVALEGNDEQKMEAQELLKNLS
jgi:pilus assembly protein FimV